MAITESTRRIFSVQVSAMFMAILDFVLDNPDPRVTPQVTSLAITSDGFLMAWSTASPLKEGMVGDVSSLERNLRGVCDCAGLSPAEIEATVAQAFSKIADWRSYGRQGCNPYAQPVGA